jgi:3-dehydroquinate synthase
MSLSFIIEDKIFILPQNFSSWSKIRVKSIPKDYEVIILKDNPINQVKEILKKFPNCLVLADKKVYELHLSNLKIDKTKIFLHSANENFKTKNGVFKVIDFLERNNFTKGDKLLVIGGGVIEDVGAFVSATFKRGIDWIYFPTTLLSMCDSCIGGKTGINYKKAKNQLALFSSPSKVIINPIYLETLPYRYILSGLGEVLKLHITGGNSVLKNYLRNIDLALKYDYSSLMRLIRTSLSVKRAVVEYDQFEINIRRSMNYGHTIGHALETMSHYKISHGEAVCIGMIIVNEMSCSRGFLNAETKKILEKDISRIIDRNTLNRIRLMDQSQLIELLMKDKKTQGQEANFVFIKDIGKIFFYKTKINKSLFKEIGRIIKMKFYK